MDTALNELETLKLPPPIVAELILLSTLIRVDFQTP
jgi:hypothetical protein